jgi:hypothetical protein
MASLFPNSVDTFANPIYTKVDGIDVVQAIHVNDLQDAVRATQQALISGSSIVFSSNFYIADNTSLKSCLEVLDTGLHSISEAFIFHREAALISDPAQHHANTIAIDPIGNLQSSRVQPAIYELQSDIDNILGVGTLSPDASLDNRYVMKSGQQSMQGPLVISSSLQVGGSTNLGSEVSDSHIWTGSFNLNGNVNVTGSLEVSENITVPYGKKIAALESPSFSYLFFSEEKIELFSQKDIVFKIDSDDATDQASNNARFTILDGLNQEILGLSEEGNLSISSQISSTILEATNLVKVGEETLISSNLLSARSNSYQVQLDKENTQATARFFVTNKGDTGVNVNSPNMLLNVDHLAKLTTGVHVLKGGVQETGYFGHKTFSNNAGGVFYGFAVNFKHELTNAPASIVLNLSEVVNAQNISVTDITKYGFFVEFDSIAVGAAKVLGTYQTIGN